MKDKTTQPPQSVGENCKNKAKEIIAEFSNSVNIEELKNKKVEWLIPNFIPKKTIINIYGKPGTGKSILALYLCKFLLDNDKVKEIYYLDADNTEIVYADRKTYEIMQNHLQKFHLQIFENLIDKKSKYDFVQNFAQRADDLSDTLLVFDSIRDFMNINMQSDKEVNDFLSNLKTLRAKNATIIFLHHQPKQYGDENNKIAKGSTGFTETPDAPYFLDNKTDEYEIGKNKIIFTLEPQKPRYKIKPYAFIIDTQTHSVEISDFLLYGLNQKERNTLAIAREVIKEKGRIQQSLLAKKINAIASENQVEILGLNNLWNLLAKYNGIHFKIERENNNGCIIKSYYSPL